MLTTGTEAGSMPFALASAGKSWPEAPPAGVPSLWPTTSLSDLIGLDALVISANGALL